MTLVFSFFSYIRISKAIDVELYQLLALKNHFEFNLNNIESEICDSSRLFL